MFGMKDILLACYKSIVKIAWEVPPLPPPTKFVFYTESESRVQTFGTEDTLLANYNEYDQRPLAKY